MLVVHRRNEVMLNINKLTERLMKKIMIVLVSVLGVMAGLTSLTANAANGDIRYGTWVYYTQYVGKVGWDTHRQCIYKRSAWKYGYGALPDEMQSVFVINKGCPSASSIK